MGKGKGPKVKLMVREAAWQPAGAQPLASRESSLFKQESLEKLESWEFEESKSYQYVGVKQLRAFYDRTRKLSRDNKRATMLSSFLSHTLSTLSS